MIETLKPFTPEQLPDDPFSDEMTLSLRALERSLEMLAPTKDQVYAEVPFGPNGPMQTIEDLPDLVNSIDVICSGSAQTGPHPNDIDGDPTTD